MAATPPDLPTPRANPDLLGHEAAEGILLRALASGRLPHGWLITGPRGIGKATLAYRFARFLLNGGAGESDLFGGPPEGLRVDPDAPAFRQIAAGAHGDLKFVERRIDERNRLRREIVVDDLRGVTEFLHMTAADDGWRVVVVDSADELNRAAANALLKMLEEPPARALLILVSHAPGGLLPTIRSRCCHLALSPLDDETLGRLLATYRPDLGPEEAGTIIGLADGSIGRALDLAAGGGLELYRALVALLARLPDTPIEAIHAFGDSLARDSSGTSFRTGTDLLQWWLARMIRGGARGELPADVLEGDRETMARLLSRRGADQWLALWERQKALFARTEGANLDRKQAVLTAFIDLQRLAA